MNDSNVESHLWTAFCIRDGKTGQNLPKHQLTVAMTSNLINSRLQLSCVAPQIRIILWKNPEGSGRYLQMKACVEDYLITIPKSWRSVCLVFLFSKLYICSLSLKKKSFVINCFPGARWFNKELLKMISRSICWAPSMGRARQCAARKK